MIDSQKVECSILQKFASTGREIREKPMRKCYQLRGRIIESNILLKFVGWGGGPVESSRRPPPPKSGLERSVHRKLGTPYSATLATSVTERMVSQITIDFK